MAKIRLWWPHTQARRVFRVLVVTDSTLGRCLALAQCDRSCPGRDRCHDLGRDGDWGSGGAVSGRRAGLDRLYGHLYPGDMDRYADPLTARPVERLPDQGCLREAFGVGHLGHRCPGHDKVIV